MQPDSLYLTAAHAAAATRTAAIAARFGLSRADREDLHQELMLDLLERAPLFDPAKGSVGTFTGLVSKHRSIRLLEQLMKDRTRLSFAAANDDDPLDSSSVADGSLAPLWTHDQDLFAESDTLRDLATGLAYMDAPQQATFALLNAHEDLPEACRASGLSTATFYRRVAELRMHLRMFGFKAAA